DVRVERGHERDVRRPRDLHAGGAEHDWVDDVDDVRLERIDPPPDIGAGDADDGFGVHGQGKVWHRYDMSPAEIGHATIRRHEQHLVTTAGEPADGVTEAGDHAVHRRDERLREDGDSHQTASLAGYGRGVRPQAM